MGVEMAVMIMIGLVILIIMVLITIMAIIWGQEISFCLVEMKSMSNVYGDDKGLEFDHYDIDYYYNNDGDALLVEICLRLVQSDDATGP